MSYKPYPEELQTQATYILIEKLRISEANLEASLIQVKKLEERANLALEGSHLCVWDWNPQTDEANYSLSWKEMLGYAEHEFPSSGRAWMEHLHPDDKDITLSALQAYLDGSMPTFSFEFRMLCKNGSWKWILSRGKLVARDANGEPLRLVGTHSDISERKLHDHILQEKNIELENARIVAERASLAKSEFLSSMSHELRSPLNAILGFSQLMESDSPPPSPVQNERITQIISAGWHLLKLINEILDLAKIESGHMLLSQESVSLTEIIRECQSMIEPQAQQRDIQQTIPRSDIPYFVYADRTRLKQVLINLLSNAIKYNREQGMIEVKCAESTFGRTRVSIIDTGVGMSPEQLAQLFQPFNRLGQEYSGTEGTGIGLVVVKQLIELMGGSVGVESTAGVGSLFWFELMEVAEPHLAMEGGESTVLTQQHLLSTAEKHMLLYVEDNPANMKLVEQTIARHPNMRLLTAVNGNSGIEIARIFRPKVILMDINLPDISGVEAMKILRSDPITAHIPVIAISANAIPIDIASGMKAGFFCYITKPFQLNEFMEALSTAMAFAERTMPSAS